MKDVIALMKPRITLLSVATAAVGLALAPGEPAPSLVWWTLLGTLLLVGSANTLNMWLERDVDALMKRTRSRPLPAGRLAPGIALFFGVAQATIAIPMLAQGANPLTGALGALALFLYVGVYTPLKRVTTLSLLVGAIPGAMPPLLGWTAASGRVEIGALALFAVIFFWQVPHFIAIAMFRREDYVTAGLKILPHERGDAHSKRMIVTYLLAQVAVTLLLVPLGLGGPLYLAGALVLGGGLIAWGLVGLRRPAEDLRWAVKLFVATVAYLPLLFALLVAS
jgi:protoheme IX farnesyltransferase